LQPGQVGPTKRPIEPIVVASINEGENDFRIVEMEEYEEIVYRRQAKKWVDSLIITPNSLSSGSPNKSRRTAPKI